MKRYALPELIKRWEREEVTIEQTVGQILLWLERLSAQLEKLERKQRQKRQHPKADETST